MSRKLKVAVVGAGWVTKTRHIPALLGSGRCELIGVVDRNLEKAEELARRLKLPHAGNDLDAAWIDEIDAATVGVTPMGHYEVASRLLARGKHVLLEKPMCLKVEEGEDLVRQAKSRGLVLAIVHNFQFAHSVAKARAIIDSGRWGKITGLHGFQLSSHKRRLPVWYEELPLGLFYDESPHLLYLLRAFGGQLKLEHAHVVRSAYGHVTPAVVQVGFRAEDFAATLYMNFETPVSEWQFLIMTEAGVAVMDIFRDILHFVPADGLHQARDIARSSWSLVWGHSWGFITSGARMLSGRLLYGNEEVVRRFFDAIEGKAELRDIDAAAALDVLKLQHAIIERAK